MMTMPPPGAPPPGAPPAAPVPSGLPPTPDQAPRPAHRVRRVVAAAVVALLLLAGGFTLGGLRPRSTTTAVTVASAVSAPVSSAQTPSGASSSEPIAAAAKALAPSVVEISTGAAVGSGVIYDASGLILTNAHVVEGARRLTVTLDDGTTLAGTVVGSDTTADVAVVRIDPGTSELTAAALSTDAAEVGQTVIAIGSPYGLDETVTAGIVSAVERTVDASAGESIPMIQTDASINPGNSGGALADRDGVVIGINTAIYSQTGDNSGIGFAIPIQTARQIADELVAATN